MVVPRRMERGGSLLKSRRSSDVQNLLGLFLVCFIVGSTTVIIHKLIYESSSSSSIEVTRSLYYFDGSYSYHEKLKVERMEQEVYDLGLPEDASEVTGTIHGIPDEVPTEFVQYGSLGELEKDAVDALKMEKAEETFEDDPNEDGDDSAVEDDVYSSKIVMKDLPETFQNSEIVDFDLTDPALLDVEAWQRVPEKYRITNDTKGKFFLYQPSGGWGNQRLILRWAIIAANAMNRTLVLPPVAMHTNFYQNFNLVKKDGLMHMGQVLDLDTLNAQLQMGIKVHDGDMDSYLNEILRGNGLTWRVYEKPTQLFYIQERVIYRKWHDEPADVVLWEKSSMWKCCATADQFYYTHINYGLVFSKHLQAIAMQGASVLGPRYNAVHFRRGDSLIRERRSVRSYTKRHAISMYKFDKRIPLYIATDEKDKSFFHPFIQSFGYEKLVFADDLKFDVIRKLLDHTPINMQGTLLGFVEQIICLYAERWTGSTKSTFSYVISGLRNRRRHRGPYFTKNKRFHFLPRTATIVNKSYKQSDDDNSNGDLNDVN